MSQIFTMLPWNISNGFWGTLFYALLVVGLWRVFEKAHEAGWKALIPFYNIYIVFKICRIPVFFFFWLLLTVLSGGAYWLSSGIFLFYPLAWALSFGAALMQMILWVRLSRAFGHGFLFALGLWIFNPIFLMMLGYSSDYYNPYF